MYYLSSFCNRSRLFSIHSYRYDLVLSRLYTFSNNIQSPESESVSRWIRSLILHWINKDANNQPTTDIHSQNNLNQLSKYLNDNTSNGDILSKNFSTLKQLHLLLIANPNSLTVKHISITLNAYTRLKALFPQKGNQISSMSLQLINVLYNNFAHSQIHSANEQDISLLFNAISKLNIRHGEFLSKLELILSKKVHDDKIFIETFTAQGVSMVLNAFQKIGWIPSKYLLLKLSQFALEIIDQFTLKQLLLTCHAISKLEVSESFTIPLIEKIDELLSTSKEIDLKLLGLSLYTFGKLEHMPKLSEKTIVKELSKHFGRTSITHGKESEELITNIIYGLSQLNWKIAIVDKLFSTYNQIKHTTIGLSIIITSLCRLDHKKMIQSIMLFGSGVDVRNKYNELIKTFFERVKFTSKLGQDPDFTESSSASLVTPKQISNVLFSFVLSSNCQPSIYYFLINNFAVLESIRNLHLKATTQLAATVQFLCTEDPLISKLPLSTIKYLYQTILSGIKYEKESKYDYVKSSKIHLSIASVTRQVVKTKYTDADVLIEYKTIPYTIDILIKQ